MREKINFHYEFLENDFVEKQIEINIQNKEGLNLNEVCDAFIDFLNAIGYAEQSACDYFRDYVAGD